MPAELAPALDPVLKVIEDLTRRIRHYDTLIEQLCDESYPETQGMRAISGVGPVTSLARIIHENLLVPKIKVEKSFASC
jgi:hypothetical protein